MLPGSREPFCPLHFIDYSVKSITFSPCHPVTSWTPSIFMASINEKSPQCSHHRSLMERHSSICAKTQRTPQGTMFYSPNWVGAGNFGTRFIRWGLLSCGVRTKYTYFCEQVVTLGTSCQPLGNLTSIL